MRQALLEYFRCPEHSAAFELTGELSPAAGYFRLGEATCYGRHCGGRPARDVGGPLRDVYDEIAWTGGALRLPFDPDEVSVNLRQERYPHRTRGALARLTGTGIAENAYYLLRPWLPVRVRKHLQKARLNGWANIPFPSWPLDCSVDELMAQVLGSLLLHGPEGRVPFIWYWPDGAEGCLMMTHDVEGQAGCRFCDDLMDLDESWNVKSAFQLIPEMSGTAPLQARVRSRGFEINLHDLNHDGQLFDDRQQFLRRAVYINRYAREFGCGGFRSAAMYREQRWFDAFEFSFDMSVPTVGHLEAQRGGCCTVMPYFVGRLVELPLTTTQDYSLFHILGDYSVHLWKTQCELILARHGLVSFITHPDYLVEKRAQAVYRDLLAYLGELRTERHLWTALPSEVDRWWRSRHGMVLAQSGGRWVIEGPDAGRARVAYATFSDNQLVYSFEADS